MAALSDQDRADTSAAYQSDRALGVLGAVTKSDVRAAINAVDDWVVANAAAYNNALPAAAKAALTAAQKSMLLSYVVEKRYQKGA